MRLVPKTSALDHSATLPLVYSCGYHYKSYAGPYAGKFTVWISSGIKQTVFMVEKALSNLEGKFLGIFYSKMHQGQFLPLS